MFSLCMFKQLRMFSKSIELRTSRTEVNDGLIEVRSSTILLSTNPTLLLEPLEMQYCTKCKGSVVDVVRHLFFDKLRYKESVYQWKRLNVRNEMTLSKDRLAYHFQNLRLQRDLNFAGRDNPHGVVLGCTHQRQSFCF